MTDAKNPLSAPTVQSLFGRAAQAGTLSTQSQTLLSGDLGPLVIAGASGRAVDDIQAGDVTLVTLLIDASTSIGERGLQRAVCAGQNQLLDAFAGSREKDAVLCALWTFASEARVVHSYVPVDDAVRLDERSYTPGGTTHLFDTFCDAAAANVAYAQTLRDAGTPVRSIVVVVTDGEDVGSRRPARTCRKLATDLLKSEQFHLAFVGVGDDVDFHAVARSMGFSDGSILVQKDTTPPALRAAFSMVSRSAVRASQGRIQPGPAAGFFAP
jgi:hypothetical protein